MSRLIAILVLGLLPEMSSAAELGFSRLGDRPSIAIVQRRDNDHVAVLELETRPNGAGGFEYNSRSRLVVHDIRGRLAPRIAFPPDGSLAEIASAAMWEEPGSANGFDRTALIVHTNHRLAGPGWGYLFSADGGATWKRLATTARGWPDQDLRRTTLDRDPGGPVALARGAVFLPLHASHPFALQLPLASPSTTSFGRIHLVSRDGTLVPLSTEGLGDELGHVALQGSSRDGESVLAVVTRIFPSGQNKGPFELWIFPRDSARGPARRVLGGDGWLPADTGQRPFFETAWIDDEGVVYALQQGGLLVADENGIYRHPGWFTATPSGTGVGAWVAYGMSCCFNQQKAAVRIRRSQIVDTVPLPFFPAQVFAGTSDNVLLARGNLPATTGAFAWVDTRANDQAAAPAHFLGEADAYSYPIVSVRPEALAGWPIVYGGSQMANSPPASNPEGYFDGSGVGLVWLPGRRRLPLLLRESSASGSTRTDVFVHNPTSEPRTFEGVPIPPSGSALVRDVGAGRTGPFSLVFDGLRAAAVLRHEGPRGITSTLVPDVDENEPLRPHRSASLAAGLLGPGFRTDLYLVGPSGEAQGISLSTQGRHVDIPPEGLTPQGDELFVLRDVARYLKAPREPGPLSLSPLGRPVFATFLAVEEGTGIQTRLPHDSSLRYRVFPELIHVPSSAGETWQTDLHLANMTGAARDIRIELGPLKRGQPYVGRLELHLAPFESRVLADVAGIASTKSLGYSASVRAFTARTAWSDGVAMAARTRIERPQGSSHYVLPPFPPFDVYTANLGSEHVLEFVGIAGEKSSLTRMTLVGFSSGPKMQIEVLGPNGDRLDLFDAVASVEAVVMEDFFAERNLGDPGAVAIRIRGEGMAFATVTDRLSGSSYVVVPSLVKRGLPAP